MRTKKPSKAELRADWLNWFKLACTQATEARRAGGIELAYRLDDTIERCYKENQVKNYYSEDELVEIESDIRNS